MILIMIIIKIIILIKKLLIGIIIIKKIIETKINLFRNIFLIYNYLLLILIFI